MACHINSQKFTLRIKTIYQDNQVFDLSGVIHYYSLSDHRLFGDTRPVCNQNFERLQLIFN